jgi:hypothetical protein
MSKKKLAVGTLFLSAGLLAGCGGGHVAVGYRAYDPGYSDYYTWDDHEGVYYNQWIVETHRPHRDYRRLRRNDQRAYWQWRHNHH